MKHQMMETLGEETRHSSTYSYNMQSTGRVVSSKLESLYLRHSFIRVHCERGGGGRASMNVKKNTPTLAKN
jgi:hypothetical protein